MLLSSAVHFAALVTFLAKKWTSHLVVNGSTLTCTLCTLLHSLHFYSFVDVVNYFLILNVERSGQNAYVLKLRIIKIHQIRLQLVSIDSKIDSSQEFEIIIIVKDSRPKIFYFWLNTDVYVVVLGRFSLLFLQ